MLVGIFFLPLIIPQSFAMCAINEDWPDAPCLDTISNDCKDAEGVGKWGEYYYLKGDSLMETKKSEMLNAFDAGTLEDWISKSHENSNVWRYYHLKGEIPDERGEYYDVDKCIPAFHIPGNPIWSIQYSSWLILALLASISSMIVVVFWRKRK